MVQVQADALRLDGQNAVVVKIGATAVRFQMQVRLAAAIRFRFDHMCSLGHDGGGFLALFHTLLVIHVGYAGVNLQRVGCLGSPTVHVGWQNFQINLDLLCCGTGMFHRVGCNNGNGITELEHLVLAQDRSIPAVALVGGKGDQSGDGVLALDILPGNYLEYAGHFLGSGGIDAFNVGMRDLCLNQCQMQRVGRHVHGDIGAEIPGAGNFSQCGRTTVFGAEDAAVIDRLAGLDQILFRFFAAHDRCCIDHGIGQRFVAGAAAGIAVAVEPGTHIFARRVFVLIEKGFCRHQEAWCTDAALCAAVNHPRHLQRVQVVGSADAFDGDDLFAVLEFADRNHASLDRFVVDEHRTGAALAVVAAHLAAGEQQLLT